MKAKNSSAENSTLAASSVNNQGKEAPSRRSWPRTRQRKPRSQLLAKLDDPPAKAPQLHDFKVLKQSRTLATRMPRTRFLQGRARQTATTGVRTLKSKLSRSRKQAPRQCQHERGTHQSSPQSRATPAPKPQKTPGRKTEEHEEGHSEKEAQPGRSRI